MNKHAPIVALPFVVAGVMATACCFVSGTRVATPTGPRRIEQLEVGDAVWSLHTETRQICTQRVVAVLRAEGQRLATVTVGEHVIDGVTEEHPFYDPERDRWLRAADLREGQAVVVLEAGDAKPAAVTSVVWRDERVPVFNITVDGHHNYFAEGVLVHNKHTSPRGDDDDRPFDTGPYQQPDHFIVPGSASPRNEVVSNPRPVVDAEMVESCNMLTLGASITRGTAYSVPIDTYKVGQQVRLRPQIPLEAGREHTVTLTVACDGERRESSWTFRMAEPEEPATDAVVGETYVADLADAQILLPWEPSEELDAVMVGELVLQVEYWMGEQMRLQAGGIATDVDPECFHASGTPGAITDELHFAAADQSVVLDISPYGPMLFMIDDFYGRFGAGGERLASLSLDGVLDTRPLVDVSTDPLCDEVPDCVPCDDGEVACIDLWLHDFSAWPIDEQLEDCPE